MDWRGSWGGRVGGGARLGGVVLMILGAKVDGYVSLRRCGSKSVFEVLKKPLGVQPSSLVSSIHFGKESRLGELVIRCDIRRRLVWVAILDRPKPPRS